MIIAPTPARHSGRPRSRPALSDLAPRQQILDAAAGLFAESGFTAATTRAIAERVGIRQASLYYHFAGKNEILLELLTLSVLPSLDFARAVESLVDPAVTPATRLYALATVDVGTLSATPHNAGTLYLLPEVQNARYDRFRADRSELEAAYGRLATAAAPRPAELLGAELTAALVMALVESAVQLRRNDTLDGRSAAAIAGACLRVIGLDPEAVAAARVGAGVLSARLTDQPVAGRADQSHRAGAEDECAAGVAIVRPDRDAAARIAEMGAGAATVEAVAGSDDDA